MTTKINIVVTSDQLQQAQDTLQALAKKEIDHPMTDYSKLKRLMQVIKEVDAERRDTWHNEKFGDYEDIVDETMNVLNLENDFTSEDIPF